MSQRAFSCSARTPQTGLAPPLRRTPPGQKDGTPARLIPRHRADPGFDVISSISALDQRFASARLPDPYLTPHRTPFPRPLTTTVFSQRSAGRFGASHRRATPRGHKTLIIRAAPIGNDLLHDHFLSFRTHTLSGILPVAVS